jgi:hypothetical protein
MYGMWDEDSPTMGSFWTDRRVSSFKLFNLLLYLYIRYHKAMLNFKCMTLQVHSPRMTRSRQHLLRLVLTVLQMHLRTRRTTYADGLGLGAGGPREREVRDMRSRYS